ncbi:Uncharacterized protein SCF082_LOCUS43572 [Durusdinium trenchii]|uniref:Uncharacterized protein n=1 Tax=Durusdinium trenchii TaxID=1381693 RepID=A0ABP0QWF1_9DINO
MTKSFLMPANSWTRSPKCLHSSVNGSALNLLLRCGQLGSTDDRLGCGFSAYGIFKTWCSSNKVECSQPMFKERMLFQKKGDILLVAKAYNSRVILEWLAHTLESVRGDYADFDEF